MNGPTTATETQSNGRRFAGAGLIIAGRILLTLSLIFAAVLVWLQLPGGPSPLRVAAFGLVGLILGPAGYWLASGRWAGAWQLPLQGAALAGLFFLAVMLKVEAGRYPPPWPPAWIIVVAALAPLLWWLAAPSRRRHRRS